MLPTSPSPAPGLSGAKPTPTAPDRETPTEPLSHFRAALTELASGGRKDHVRILFFGDSHAQGELWTGALREKLQRRFGDGGPGFSAAGSPKHRNDALHIETRGLFTIEPRDPATTTRHGDGRLGLGGLLASASRGGARVELAPRSASGEAMRWDVCSIAGSTHDVLQVSGDGLDAREIASAAGEVAHSVVTTRAPNHLAIDLDGAKLCGVVGERIGSPGVVLDALGINGARFATPLAWDEKTFAFEVARREPDLVILEYGTNEASDVPPRLDDDAKDLEALVSRVRRGAPDASCLVLGLTERDDRIETTPALRDAFGAAAERAGCAFWDTYEIMGGRGSMAKWQAATPTLAQRDGIHLTADGYTKLADLLYADLVREVPERP